jgi:hypothetical protein
MTKLEAIVARDVCEVLFDYCRDEISTKYPNSVCTEQVDVLRKEDFVSPRQIRNAVHS